MESEEGGKRHSHILSVFPVCPFLIFTQAYFQSPHAPLPCALRVSISPEPKGPPQLQPQVRYKEELWVGVKVCGESMHHNVVVTLFIITLRSSVQGFKTARAFRAE